MKQYFGGKYYKVENTKHKSLCSINLFSYLGWYWEPGEKDTIKCSKLVVPFCCSFFFVWRLMKNYVLKKMESSDSLTYSNLVPKKFQGRSRGETLKHVQYASNQEYGSIKCIAERINLLWTYIQQNYSDSAIVQQGDQKWR